LKDDTTLEEYKIEDGVTVHLVKGKSATASASSEATASASTGGLGGSTST
jgi:ubiquilin